LREKKKYIRVPFLDLEDIKILGVLLENLEVVRLAGSFERKEKVYLGSFLGLKILSMEASWSYSKGTWLS
jgi:hypothetical protein